MINLPPGFRIIREEDLPRVADYLNRYCDNDCEGIACTDTEYRDGAGCKECTDEDIVCCPECLVGFAKKDLAALIDGRRP